MKYLFLVLALASCSEISKPKQPTKEERVVVLYPRSVSMNDFQVARAFKITVDSIMPDSTNPAKNIRKDVTYYQVLVTVNVSDSLTGVLKKDSLGRQLVDFKPLYFNPKSIIAEYKTDWGEFLQNEQNVFKQQQNVKK